MKNLTTITRQTALEISAKAEKTFGTTRYGSRFSDLIGVPQPYVSKLKKFSETGNEEDLPPRKSFGKFLAFLNSDNKVAPVNPNNAPTPKGNNKSGTDLVLTLRDRKTNKFVSGVTTTEEDLRAAILNEKETSDDCKTDAEILNEIQMRFKMVNQSVSSIFRGGQSGVIVSGPAGCGKSFNVEKKINAEKAIMGDNFKFKHLKGATMSYTGLYTLLWEFRDGGVIVFDDSDKMWEDEDMMNTMKAAMDTSKKRFISTASGGRWVKNLADDQGVEEEEIREFEFKGKIIFITNKDINGLIEKGRKGSEHFAALVDRAFYVDLEMFSLRAKYLWCEYIFMEFIAPQQNLSDELTLEIMEFVSDNRYNLRGMSVREIEIIASVANDPVFANDWKDFIKVTRFNRSK